MIGADIGIILLAGGRSERFGAADKLMELLGDKPVGAYAGALFAAQRTGLHCAITPSGAIARQALYRDLGWHVLENPSPEAGQGRSLAIAVQYLHATHAKAILILLADMPFVTENYLMDMLDQTPEGTAVMSHQGDVLLPPAQFPRQAMNALAGSSGNRGARGIFKTLEQTRTQSLPTHMALDIDTPDDLARAEAQLAHV